MINHKHTPGPWTIHTGGRNLSDDETTYCIRREDGLAILDTVCELHIGPEQTVANIRLASAAPKMLAALERLSAAIDNYGGDLHNKLEGVQEARDAIAEATSGLIND